MTPKTILLTGATGFVGRHAAVALQAAGYTVRATSRAPEQARKRFPGVTFVHCDLESESSVRSAMDRTTAAIYLYHGLGTGPDYPERELAAAAAFQRAATAQGLERIVYLGGVMPESHPSKHLASRMRTGCVLRDGKTKTLELLAAMIIGHQSQSFTLVRDLVTRVPLLALPAWLDHKSCSVAICDVAAALTLALTVPLEVSTTFDIPGPECNSHRVLIEYLCSAFGTHLIDYRVPHLSPNIAATGLAFLSRVPAAVSHELVQGLTEELVPRGTSFWDALGNPALRTVRVAIADAFADEQSNLSPSPETSRRIREKTQTWLNRPGHLA